MTVVICSLPLLTLGNQSHHDNHMTDGQEERQESVPAEQEVHKPKEELDLLLKHSAESETWRNDSMCKPNGLESYCRGNNNLHKQENR